MLAFACVRWSVHSVFAQECFAPKCVMTHCCVVIAFCLCAYSHVRITLLVMRHAVSVFVKSLRWLSYTMCHVCSFCLFSLPQIMNMVQMLVQARWLTDSTLLDLPHCTPQVSSSSSSSVYACVCVSLLALRLFQYSQRSVSRLFPSCCSPFLHVQARRFVRFVRTQTHTPPLSYSWAREVLPHACATHIDSFPIMHKCTIERSC